MAAVVKAGDILGPHGSLAASLDNYEHRPGQLAMAKAVEEAVAKSHTLVCEAGTGTGKTLAYLIPAILSGRKTVISTATRALQDQIYWRDLPAIAKHTGLKPSVALTKGLSNYLCRRRFEELRKSAHAASTASATSLVQIERWARTTHTGDVAELADLPENDPVWRDVCSSTETRIGLKCQHYENCFVTHMRREAQEAQIVVANHHLVFADIALRGDSQERGGVLPEYEVLVLDEAHQIEDIASDFFGCQVSSGRIQVLLRDAQRTFECAGLSDPLLSNKDASPLTARVRDAAGSLFEQLVARYETGEPGKKRIETDTWTGEILHRYHRFDAGLEALQAFANANSKNESVEAVAQRVLRVRNDLSEIVSGNQSRAVTWIETRARSAAVGSTPIEVANILRQAVFERVPAVIATSATLTSNGTFQFFRSRVGADSPHVPTVELVVPSHFDFETQALLYTPTDLPEPADPSFAQLAVQRVAHLIEVTNGGAFVLCTSVRAMTTFRADLARMLDRAPLMQGDAPKQSLLNRFRTEKDSVLVATLSFWEGVDIAGDALRLVVIDKIPFAVPTDPVVVARCAALEQDGANPFEAYQLPAAAITLKQGFGRLIRTQRDRGIVAILDRRLVSRQYGKALLASLPPARKVSSLEQVREFWHRVAGG